RVRAAGWRHPHGAPLRGDDGALTRVVRTPPRDMTIKSMDHVSVVLAVNASEEFLDQRASSSRPSGRSNPSPTSSLRASCAPVARALVRWENRAQYLRS